MDWKEKGKKSCPRSLSIVTINVQLHLQITFYITEPRGHDGGVIKVMNNISHCILWNTLDLLVLIDIYIHTGIYGCY
jgi:hypothetical protein